MATYQFSDIDGILLNSQFYIDPSGNVAIGQAGVTDASAILELESTTQGFVLPRMTNAERDSITTPLKALQIYSLDDEKPYINIGTPSVPNWTAVAAGAAFLDDLADVILTSPIGVDEVLIWNGSHWVNNTFNEAGISGTSHTHILTDITDVTASVAEVNLLDLSGLSAGWVLKATGSTSAVWGQLSLSDLSDASNIVKTDQINGYDDGLRQTFNPDATNAGIAIGVIAGQPSSPTTSDIIYNSIAGEFQGWNGSSWVNLSFGGAGFIDGSGTANQLAYFTDSDTLSSHSNLSFDGTTLTGGGTLQLLLQSIAEIRLPVTATPGLGFDGNIAFDTTVTDFSTGLVRFYLGEEQAMVAMPVAEFTSPTDGYVVAYNGTNDEFELVAQTSGADNLGNHTATQDLDMSSYDIIVADTAVVKDSGGDTYMEFEAISSGTWLKLAMSGSIVGLTAHSSSDADLQLSGTGTGTVILNDTVGTSGDFFRFDDASEFRLPVSATPTVNADGEIAFDTTVTDFSTGLVRFYLGEEQAVVSMPVAQFTSPTDGYVVAYNGTNDEFELVAQSGGTIDGSGATNQIAYWVDSDTLTGDADFTFDGTTLTGGSNLVIDFGGASSLEIPNSAAPTVNADGEIALDTTVTDWSHGILRYYGGEEMAIVAIPAAQLTSPTDGEVLAYNATNDEIEFVAQSGSGDTYNYSSIGAPQLFNPDVADASPNVEDFILSSSNTVAIVTINGKVLDDSEYHLVGSTISIYPDNGFYDNNDEVLVFQHTFGGGGGENVNYTARTTTYTILATDYMIDCTSGTFTVTLPPAATAGGGKVFVIKNSGTGEITIEGDGSETIDGGLTAVMSTQWESLTVVSDGANYKII